MLKIDLNNRRIQLIVIGIIILIFSIIIYIVIKATKKETPREYLIDTPYSIETTHVVSMSDELKKSIDIPKQMKIYSLEDINLSSNIDSFLITIGKGNLSKTSIDGNLYIWSGEGDYVEYIKNNQSLFFKFTKPANTRMVSTDGITGKGYLSVLFNDYLGYKYEYINENITKSGYLNRIESNRSIDGYPLFFNSFQSYSDTVSVDSSGKLYEGTLLLAQIDTKRSQDVEIVTLDYLQAAIKYTQYPKTLYYGFYPPKSTSTSTKQLKEGIGLVELADSIDIDKNSIGNKIKLGYIYQDNSYNQLVPTYRIEAEGTATLNKEDLKLPLIILTNAIDPSRVYYPSK